MANWIDIPKDKTEVRMKDGSWSKIPEGTTQVDADLLWQGAEEIPQAPTEDGGVLAELPPIDSLKTDTSSTGTQIQSLDTIFNRKKEQAKELITDAKDLEAVNASLELQYQKEKDKILGAGKKEVKMQENKDSMLDMSNKDRLKSGLEIGGRKMLEPILGIASISEDISSLTAGLFGLEKNKVVENYIAKNQDAIKKLEKDLGYEEGDFITPSNIAEIGTQLTTMLFPFLRGEKTAKDLLGVGSKFKQELGASAKLETGFTGAMELGQGEEYQDAISTAGTVGAATLVGGQAIHSLIGKLTQGSESKLLNRFKEQLSMTPEEENAIYKNYADMYNIDPKTLTDNQKVSALAYGNENAKGILYASLSQGNAQKVHSEFNKFAKNLGKDLKGKIDSASEAELQKYVNDARELVSNSWKDFDAIIDTHYGDIMVDIPRTSNLNKQLLKIVRQVQDPETQAMLLEGKVNLNQLKTMKNVVGDLVFGKKQGSMNTKEMLEYRNSRKLYDTLQDLYDNNLPEIMQDSYGTLKKLTRMQKNADKKDLFERFKIEGKNIEQKHIDDITKEMRPKQKGSSYDDFISVMGKNYKGSSKLEGTLVENILNGNTKNGFVDFVKTFDNLESLNFKTAQGKALKELLTEYKNVFKNITDVKLSQIGSNINDSSGLTLNPVMSAAYSAHRHVFNNMASWLGTTQKYRAFYVLKTLPKALETKQLPKGYSIKEQRGAIAFSRFTKSLQELADQNPEELEVGTKGGYYESSQMIGETGSAKLQNDVPLADDAIRLFQENDLDTKKTWEQTKWYFDDVDDKWKFHLSGDDVRIIMPKGKMFTEGVYKMKEVIDMPKLFEAYPELADRQINFTSALSKNTLGGYSPSDGSIFINRRYDWGNKPIQKIKETLVHELQHGIQGIEGFAKGGNTGNLTFNEYASLHGEVEARALTVGKVGTYPKDIYDNEYATGYHAYKHSGIKEPLRRDMTNYRGKPVGSKEPNEVIPPKKKKQ